MHMTMTEQHRAHLNKNDNFKIGYADRAGTEGEQVITVRYNEYDDMYYAMGGRWGCGKMSRTIEGAVRMLLQDMATMIWIQAHP